MPAQGSDHLDKISWKSHGVRQQRSQKWQLQVESVTSVKSHIPACTCLWGQLNKTLLSFYCSAQPYNMEYPTGSAVQVLSSPRFFSLSLFPIPPSLLKGVGKARKTESFSAVQVLQQPKHSFSQQIWNTAPYGLLWRKWTPSQTDPGHRCI